MFGSALNRLLTIVPFIDLTQVPRPTRKFSLASIVRKFLLLIASPVIFFGALEGTLRLTKFGHAPQFFIPDDVPGFYRTNPNFTDPFIPSSFGIQPLNFRLRQHKGPNTVRIFVLGESAAQGMPGHEFGFAAQLRAQLRARFPERHIELFNLGITAINSHVIYQVVKQAVYFEPDLFVVYMGNNEVVGPYGPGCFYRSGTPPLWLIRASVWVRSTRTGQLLAAIWSESKSSAYRSQEWNGMESYTDASVRAEDPRLSVVYQNFSLNLQGILSLANNAGIKTVLSTVVSNIKDHSPFASIHRPGWNPEDAKSWKAVYDEAMIAWDLGESKSAIAKFAEAAHLDPEFAEVHFRLGRLEEALGETQFARKQYEDALHWDALRFRPDPHINQIIRQASAQNAGTVLLVDAARVMGSDPDSSSSAPGREVFFDHVHFNWAGNFKMSGLLADGCLRQLFGSDVEPNSMLDSSQSAASVGYTPEAQLEMLGVIKQLTLKPPFTKQFTFSEDEAILQREIEGTTSSIKAPGAALEDMNLLARAYADDKENAFLAERLGEMELNRGDPERALSLFDSAELNQPKSAELSKAKALALVRLQRYDEAESVLLSSLGLDSSNFAAALSNYGKVSSRSVRIIGGALFDLWAESRQFSKGKDFFSKALKLNPKNVNLRLEYANLLYRDGELTEAEREAELIWSDDRGDRFGTTALELLIHIYKSQGRTEAANSLTLQARIAQPQDQYNLQRLITIYEEKSQPADVAECLLDLAAVRPFNAEQHLELARRLADLDRTADMLNELSHAKEIAQVEGNSAVEQTCDDLIAVCRQHFGEERTRQE